MIKFISYIDSKLSQIETGDFFIAFGVKVVKVGCYFLAVLALLSVLLGMYTITTLSGKFWVFILVLLLIAVQSAYALILVRIGFIRSKQIEQMEVDGDYTAIRVAARILRSYGEVTSLGALAFTPVGILTGVLSLITLSDAISNAGLIGLLQSGLTLYSTVTSIVEIVGGPVIALMLLFVHYVGAGILTAVADIASSNLKLIRQNEERKQIGTN